MVGNWKNKICFKVKVVIEGSNRWKVVMDLWKIIFTQLFFENSPIYALEKMHVLEFKCKQTIYFLISYLYVYFLNSKFYVFSCFLFLF